MIDGIQKESVGTRRRICIWRKRSWVIADEIGAPIASNTAYWCVAILRTALIEDRVEPEVYCGQMGK
jgi:hypothetical protein